VSGVSDITGGPDVAERRRLRLMAGARRVTDAAGLGEQARAAEAAGYDVLAITDHLCADQLAPAPALAVVAAATDRLRIATLVLNNDLRHPAVLAQELATLDVLSGGRLEIGLGAGWNRAEYAAAGIPFAPGAVRVERLAETVRILKGLAGEGPFTMRGTHYAIAGLDGLPKPVQRPHPPLLIGGGSRRVLALAAREADIVGLLPRADSLERRDFSDWLPAAAAEKVAFVRQAAGDRFERLELSTCNPLWPVQVTDRARAVATEMAARIEGGLGMRVSAEDLLESPFVFIGSVDHLVDKLRDLRDRLGVGSVMLGELDDRVTPIVERLAAD
jgi:probable F420-dependent oxidoreductase